MVKQAQELRSVIGLSGQYAAVDENLTGAREPVDVRAAVPAAQRRCAKQRAGELLEQFDLVDAGDRVVKTYSGGMRRRLDLASALIGRPRLLFLDEPTTGLDPRSRLGMWEVIRGLVREGTTLLLTTQYLEEADELANTIAVVDHGKIIARGTADELKTPGRWRAHRGRGPRAGRHPERAAGLIRPFGVGDAVVDEHTSAADAAIHGWRAGAGPGGRAPSRRRASSSTTSVSDGPRSTTCSCR